ncbi:class II aldolase/adducin family protein [Carboxydothermus pertinax]|uniref:Aldolase n=1 Tax=Carboxydothermus pertinax TaxID=870242 RepID=A0A1L8CXM2_9THEO|nr:class II aldolase/adducin family protein [Carboxydothermus pertinax]GAV23682.1 aldolase [Carboxydothermus pertinax]
MKLSVEKIKEKIVKTTQKLCQYGLMFYNWGSLSVYIPEENVVVITPLTPDMACLSTFDVLIVDMDGNVLEGENQAKFNLKLHRQIYNVRSDVRAIIHAHPVNSTVLSILHEPLPLILPEMVRTIGKDVPITGSLFIDSPAYLDEIKALAERHNAFLLANNGLVTLGKNLDESFNLCRMVEKCSEIYLQALRVKEPRVLNLEEINYLKNLF